jgi:plasmanylethanolamine desaturase
MPFVICFGFLTNSPCFISQTYNWMIIFGVILGILTNEIHKWSHMVHSKPHRIIRFLQSAGLIISHEKHHAHHQGKFDSDYCIINGWMNPFLDKIDFWRKMERLITKYTGCIPRQDDEFWRSLKPKSK